MLDENLLLLVSLVITAGLLIVFLKIVEFFFLETKKEEEEEEILETGDTLPEEFLLHMKLEPLREIEVHNKSI